ncbi:ROK family protein [Jeotgalibaca sp. A127]|uniref:ROK family protein n=1 Tax=Jeotgalibaca sp. A127 TaxID=3457324 RepID=UPI003FD59644
MSNLYGSIEAGGTKFVLAVGDGELNIIKRITIPTRSPGETIKEVIDFFKDYSLKGIGLGSFGPADINKGSSTYGYITNTPKLSWNMYDIVGNLERALNVPIYFTTDVNAACYGEYVKGNAQGTKSCVYFTVGTGVGAGAINAGEFIQGFGHPEMGHMIVKQHHSDTYEGNCPFHKNCLEGLAAGPTIEDRLGIKGEQIEENNPVWDYIADYLAQAAYNTTLFLSPQVIIFGGGVMNQPYLLDKIKANFKELMNDYVATPDLNAYILQPELKDNAGTIGCLALAKKHFE